MMKLKILVCCFKDSINVQNDNYLPIQVGKKNISEKLDIIGDDTGDNISEKNGSYCELTGMYWAWKNLKDVDYIGLCHYRRFFDFSNPMFSLPAKTIDTNSFSKLNFEIPPNVKDELEKGTVILPKSESTKLSLYTEYCVGHHSEDFRTLEKVINSFGDKKYSDAFEKVMYHNNEFFPYNMMIMSWQEYTKYCDWLFSVLKEVEDVIDTSAYSPYQKRIFGFMGERLLNVYLEANKLNTKEYPVFFVSNDILKRESYLVNKMRRIFNRFSAKYVSPKKIK